MASALELYNQYQHLITKITADYPTDDEDVQQDAHLGLWVAASEYDAGTGYLFVDVAEININFSIVMGIEDRTGENFEIEDWVVNPEDEAISRINIEEYARAVSELNTLERLCVQLPYSLTTLAKKYGISRTTLAKNRRTILLYILDKLC